MPLPAHRSYLMEGSEVEKEGLEGIDRIPAWWEQFGAGPHRFTGFYDGEEFLPSTVLLRKD